MATATSLQHPRVRLYDQVRSVHLERARELEPAAIVFRSKRYDFDENLTDGLELAQAGTLAAARLALTSRITHLEINEPLYLDALPRTAVTLFAIGLRRVVGAPRVTVATYAIENLGPFETTPTRFKTRIRRRIERLLAEYVWRRVDNAVFGTAGAHGLYAQSFRNQPPRHSTVEALPSPCPCTTDAPGSARDRNSVVFLGNFGPRKGFSDVLAAWPLVRESRPDARLTLLGTGSQLDDARAAAAEDPTITLVVDPPRSAIHDHLRTAHALVLPSRRMPGWREQVGLPIVEALAHGCEIVTTDETGIADWLREKRHRVLPSDASPARIAGAIVSAVDDERSLADILATLPAVDGRIAAGRLLFDDAAHPVAAS
ncbi:glycosyltransferase family 4 protein [Leifsonia sp. Root227]|uniref:glycosyltransferase family 4 protein n=1 Tax=Leifsonia sp. Root227 TaxID=1736496 RepID=UPI000A889E32|nr:glycosyltransferase family 4 protein [Leifsonia sp. Root227]